MLNVHTQHCKVHLSVHLIWKEALLIFAYVISIIARTFEVIYNRAFKYFSCRVFSGYEI